MWGEIGNVNLESGYWGRPEGWSRIQSSSQADNKTSMLIKIHRT
jgi:hypothetical protein